jgi:hypothetical protein
MTYCADRHRPQPMTGVEIMLVGMAGGWLAVHDRFNPDKRGFLIVLLLDGGIANSQSRTGQDPTVSPSLW